VRAHSQGDIPGAAVDQDEIADQSQDGKDLGITVPTPLLGRADEMIE